MSDSHYPEQLFNVVLVQPEIPNNTGNIGRTCVGLWSKLHLVGPLGFSLDDKYLKRAGLDYWDRLEFQYYQDWPSFLKKNPQQERFFFLETGGGKTLYQADFKKGDYLLFGSETKGLDEDIIRTYHDQIYTVPFPGDIRSFNLANTVAMCMSEAFRQVMMR